MECLWARLKASAEVGAAIKADIELQGEVEALNSTGVSGREGIHMGTLTPPNEGFRVAFKGGREWAFVKGILTRIVEVEGTTTAAWTLKRKERKPYRCVSMQN